MRRFRSCGSLTLLLGLLLWLHTTRASAQSWEEESFDVDLQEKISEARGKQFVLGMGAAATGLTTGVVTTFVLAGACGLECVEGMAVAAPVTFIALVPTFTASTVQSVGKAKGIDGSYGRAWAGSLLGTLGGGGAGLLLGFAGDDLSAMLWTVPLGAVLGASIGATRGYNRSARARAGELARALRPSLASTSDKAGAMVTVSGVF